MEEHNKRGNEPIVLNDDPVRMEPEVSIIENPEQQDHSKLRKILEQYQDETHNATKGSKRPNKPNESHERKRTKPSRNIEM